MEMPPGFVEIAWVTAGPQDREHGTRDRKLVFQRKRGEFRERAGHVERRGEHTCLHFATAALRIEEHKPVEEFDFVRGADAAVKVVEIGATAEGYVLAIVNVLAVGQNVGSSAAAEEGALFE